MVQQNTQYIRRVPFNELKQHFPNISDLGLQIISGLTADLPGTQTMATNAQGSAAAAAQSASQAQQDAAASAAIAQGVQNQADNNSTNISQLQTEVVSLQTNVLNLQSAVTALQNGLTAINTPSGIGLPEGAAVATRTQLYIQTTTPTAAIWFNPTIGANTGWLQIV